MWSKQGQGFRFASQVRKRPSKGERRKVFGDSNVPHSRKTKSMMCLPLDQGTSSLISPGDNSTDVTQPWVVARSKGHAELRHHRREQVTDVASGGCRRPGQGHFPGPPVCLCRPPWCAPLRSGPSVLTGQEGAVGSSGGNVLLSWWLEAIFPFFLAPLGKWIQRSLRMQARFSSFSSHTHYPFCPLPSPRR